MGTYQETKALKSAEALSKLLKIKCKVLREGKIKINYIDEALQPILSSTYGVIIYQEQIMQIARVMGGYTLAEADILRRAMSKKKEDILIKEKPRFINRLQSRGYKEEVAIKIYDLIRELQ